MSSSVRTHHSTVAHCPPVCSRWVFNSAPEPSWYVFVRASCGAGEDGVGQGDGGTPCLIATDIAFDACRRRNRQRTSPRSAQLCNSVRPPNWRGRHCERLPGFDSDDLCSSALTTRAKAPAGLGVWPCRDLLVGAAHSQGRAPHPQQPGRGVRRPERSHRQRHRPRCPHASDTRPCTELPAVPRRRAWCMCCGRGSERRH